MVIDRLYSALHQLSLPRTRWIIIGLYLLLLTAIGMEQGILTDKEALKYIGCAKDVLSGDFTDLTGNYLKYGAYVLFLLPFVAVGKVWLAIVVQVLFGILAAEALARFAERSTGNVGLGRLAMALFLLCPLIQSWTLALYTEHFFTCMAILFVERSDRADGVTPLVIALGIIALFARPIGLFFVAPTLLWKWCDRSPGALKPWLMPVGCSVLFLFAVSVPRIAPAQLAPIASGQVIAGMGGGDTAGFEGNTILDAQRHLFGQLGSVGWAKITLYRIGSLFTLTRPSYSAMHNGLNAVFYLLYPFALYGLWHWRKNRRVQLVFIVLLLNSLLVALTHDEWSGRFMVPLFPWIIVLAVHGAQKAFSSTP